MDDTTVADGLPLIIGSSGTFAEEFDPSLVTEPVLLGPGCVSAAPKEEPEPSPPSTLRARRFAGDPVLEACLSGEHRMMAPEEGDAVLKVQGALVDLGFALPEFGADGKFGRETGVAVTAFKTEHDLQPTDPVVGPLTMGKLDELFADE